jgi:subtilisin family serine protease
VDSGVHAEHPHVGGIAGGASLCESACEDDTTDRVGHGTAVAAAIREKAPQAALYAVKVFDRSLATGVDTLVRGICLAADAGVQLVNLSLGTARAAHAARLSDAIAYASARGSLVIAAEESDGTSWYPGSLPGVLPVRLDWSCPRDRCRVDASGRFHASGYARPIPGVPPDANLRGVSFAVANVTGLVARAIGEESADLPPELDTIVKHFTESQGAAAPARPPHPDMARTGVRPR